MRSPWPVAVAAAARGADRALSRRNPRRPRMARKKKGRYRYRPRSSAPGREMPMNSTSGTQRLARGRAPVRIVRGRHPRNDHRHALAVAAVLIAERVHEVALLELDRDEDVCGGRAGG